MNLLPQSLEEFEEEYTGVEDVYIAYKRREKDRLSKLYLKIFFFSAFFLKLNFLLCY